MQAAGGLRRGRGARRRRSARARAGARARHLPARRLCPRQAGTARGEHTGDRAGRRRGSAARALGGMSPAAGPPIPVIDMWAPIVPSREVIVELRAGFPVEQLQYLEVFAKRKVSTSEFAAYAASLEHEDEQIVAALDAAGIVRSLIT